MADKIIQPNPKFKNPHIPDMQTYQEMYQESIKNPKRFFGKEAEENLSWFQKFSSVHNDQFENTKWFNGSNIGDWRSYSRHKIFLWFSNSADSHSSRQCKGS